MCLLAWIGAGDANVLDHTSSMAYLAENAFSLMKLKEAKIDVVVKDDLNTYDW